MSNEAHPGSDAWIEALDYPPEARAEVSENRRRYLEEAKKFRKESVAWDEGRLAEVFESQLSDGGSTSKQPEAPTPEEVARLAKERAEFKEMMQAKREAKQAARAEEEKGEFLDFMREWIATKWDGEAPDHLKKALSTGDPKDLGMLIHEWHDFKAAKANRAVVASCPTGFVYLSGMVGSSRLGSRKTCSGGWVS